MTGEDPSFLTLNSGHQLCYTEFGDTKGAPLFYMHGWPSSRLQAQSLDELGRELGLRIISPDRPGMGQSDQMPKRSLLDWPPIISELADHLKVETFYLMGVSGGGPYTLSASCLLNDRVRATAIVCGAPPLAELPDRSAMIWPYRAMLNIKPLIPYLLKPAAPVMRWMSNKEYHQAPLSWVVASLSEKDQDLLIHSSGSRFTLLSFRESLVNGAPGLYDDSVVYTRPWNLDFQSITHPIHFWHGRDDQNIPFTMAEHLASQVPQAQTHWLDGEGHYTVPIVFARDILESLLG